MPIRILIADRQQMYREAVARLLEREPDLVVAGETDNGERLPALVQELKPDMLLLETRLRRRSGIDALHEIMDSGVRTHSVLLTEECRMNEIIQALIHGARGVVKKDADTATLFKAIRAVSAGEFWVSHDGIGELVRNLRSLASLAEQNSRLQIKSMTKKQQRIVEAIVEGCTNSEIAAELSISERAVKSHLTLIFRKLGVSSRMELARFTLKNRYVREA